MHDSKLYEKFDHPFLHVFIFRNMFPVNMFSDSHCFVLCWLVRKPADRPAVAASLNRDNWLGFISGTMQSPVHGA